MAALHEDWEILIGLFPPNWRGLGWRSGAIARLRGFRSPEDVLRTLLLHVGCGWSLRETAVHAKLAGIAWVAPFPPGATISQSKPPIRSRWREFQFAFHRVIEAVAPRVGLETTLHNWNRIAADLAA